MQVCVQVIVFCVRHHIYCRILCGLKQLTREEYAKIEMMYYNLKHRMEIIQKREWAEYMSLRHLFRRHDSDRANFCFPVDNAWNLECFDETFRSQQEEAYARVKREAAEGILIDMGIQEELVRYRKERIGLCDCGTQVELNRFTNTCIGCGTDYNSAGTALASRSQWGKETGESLSDILMIP
jgi:hypothetical protein